MKHSYLISIALAIVLAASSAQADSRDRQHRGPDVDKHVERLSAELDLTTEQSDQLLVILQASAAEREALRDKYAAQMKPELCSLHLATMAQVQDILSGEQAAELEAKLERWAADDAPGGRHHGKKARALKDCEPKA
jgi:Spy/CpxP family protein refolding chaperone